MDSLRDVGAMAGAEVVRPEVGGLEVKVSEMADQAFTAWRTRGIEGSVSLANGYEFPAATAAALLPIELMLHGWDLAEGSGRRLVVADPLVAYVRAMSEDVIPGGRGRSFGDEVEPGGAADALERFAAYAGRSPLATT